MKTHILILFLILFLAPTALAEISGELEEEIRYHDGEDQIEILVRTNGSIVDEGDFSNEIDVKRNYRSLDTAFLEVEPDHVEKIEQNPYVKRVGPNFRVKPMLSESRTQINADFKNSFEYNGSNVSIAVMDSGISPHPAIEITERADFTGEGQSDESGHGTHVAGIIASKNRRYTGIAPGSNIYDLKVLDSEGAGKGSDMLAGLSYAVRNDVDIAVLSLGSIVEKCNGRDILSRAVDQASRTGMVVVVAAGNQGPEESTITSPGCSREAITVGAADKNGKIAPYSSRGLTADGRVKPDVVAPGSNIASANADGGFIRRSGTSMAAPHVAGQAAILLSSGQSPRSIKQNIINSSNDLGYFQRIQGSGMIDVRESLNISDQSIDSREISWSERIRAWISQLLFLY